MDLSNYVDVPTRFAALLAKWPELRIREERPQIVTIGDKTFISVTMQAWRTPDDPIFCQATCFEPYPGKTSFTRDSEQMNLLSRTLGRSHDVIPEDGLTGGSSEPSDRRSSS